ARLIRSTGTAGATGRPAAEVTGAAVRRAAVAPRAGTGAEQAAAGRTVPVRASAASAAAAAWFR
ncbi:MAG: bifunctional adenosylcobinamide kinase/adenosylcobinamide-phosphate guanylyltransferase, partial [Actinobacteria bacterium]|nr:bifunctional adenosylcobinamide kinase/adenosylcobinamide-phosphate guanylyltransferase [Actinomycetota bacterium]